MNIKKFLYSFSFVCLGLLSCGEKEEIETNGKDPEYTFVRDYTLSGGKVERNVLESYLSRAISQNNFCQPKSEAEFQENFRMIQNIGAKFIGRAAFEWTPEVPNEEHFELVKKYTDRVHAADPEMIIQCCVFEAVFKTGNAIHPEFGVDIIPIPDWVFKAFNLPVEDRNFSYDDMLFEHQYHNHWVKNASVPDITKLETQLYFYYRAVRYIDAGCEAIHWGQFNLTGSSDKNNDYACWTKVLSMVRKYASENARRKTVLYDAHAGYGAKKKDGTLLLDFNSFPLRPVTNCAKKYDTYLRAGFGDAIYKKSIGGVTPSGWTCNHLPYLVELDNSNCEWDAIGTCNGKNKLLPWGWDEISWFAHCTDDYRNYWLEYAYNWLKENDPIGFLKMPGNTPIVSGVEINGKYTPDYRVNTNSSACPNGFGQEETIKKLWCK